VVADQLALNRGCCCSSISVDGRTPLLAMSVIPRRSSAACSAFDIGHPFSVVGREFGFIDACRQSRVMDG